MIQQIVNNKGTRLFIILGGFFIANAMAAEFMGVKIFSLEGTLGINPANINIFGGRFDFNLTAGVLLWPVVFIMTDIINEYYGTKGVKFLSYLTIGLVSYAFIMFAGAIQLQPAGFWQSKDYLAANVPDANQAYKGVFGQGMWIIIGSMVAFLVGQVLDVVIFHKIKQATGEKKIWLRATGSTLISQLIDSFVVLFIAFYVGPRIQAGQGTAWSFQQLMVVGTGNYMYKFAVALLLTPVIYLVHGWIEKYLGHDMAREMKMSAMKQ